MKEKSINISTIILIICIIVLLIMGYYIHKITTKNTELSKNTNKLEQDIIKIKNEKEQKENNKEEQDGKIENDKLIQFRQKYLESIESLIIDNNRISISLFNRKEELPGISEIYVNSNGEAYIVIDSESNLYSVYGNEYKVETNVANIYVYNIGNNGLSDAIFLKKDGTASKIEGTEVVYGNIESKQISNVKNAINVINYLERDKLGAGGYGYAFIDINGNLIK